VAVFCSKAEMNNPYHQFTLRPRLNARLQAVQAHTSGSSLNSSNLRNATLGTVRMLPPALPYDSPAIYNALSYNAPSLTVNGVTDFTAVDRATCSQYPRYTPNCDSGMAVMPVTALFGGNQPFLHQPTNLPDAAGIRMSSNVQAADLLQQFITENAAVLHNQIPMLQPQSAPVQQSYSVPVVPGVPVIPSKLDNTASMLSNDVNIPFHQVLQPQVDPVQQSYSVRMVPPSNLDDTANMLSSHVSIPFRQVQWIPPGVQETGVLQIPYAVEIKPDNDETLSDHVPSGNAAVTDSAFAGTDANEKSECANEQSAPTVYLDIAMDSSSRYLDGNTRTAGTSSVDNDVVVVKVTGKTGKRKGRQSKSKSAAKVLKLGKPKRRAESTLKPCVVSLVPLDVSHITRPESNDSVEETCMADNQELVEPDIDASSMREVRELWTTEDASTVPEVENSWYNEEIPLPVLQQSTDNRDSDQLIGSDEDVGTEDAHVDEDCSLKEDANSRESECYEVVPMNSDALAFDMECDGDKAGETLRVLLPSKKVKTTEEKTKSTRSASKLDNTANKLSDDVSIPSTSKSTRSASKLDNTANKLSDDVSIPSTSRSTGTTVPKMPACRRLLNMPPLPPLRPVLNMPAASDSQIAVDTDNTDDVLVISNTSKSVTTSLRLLAASVCSEKVSAMQNQLETVEIKSCENCLLSTPLQSSFFRFEEHSSQVFKVLSMEKSSVLPHMLTLRTDLVASADATVVDKRCSDSDMSENKISSIPSGGSRTLWFQCLFCPYGELSAKRVMAHVKQQHRKYASFMRRGLLPRRQALLYIYCRHCNFVTYDSAAMFIHFAVYHKVAGILLPQPKDIEDDPRWAPVISKYAKAQKFPFYCCPDCSYVDVESNRIIQHMLRKHCLESVFLCCVVRLIMVCQASKHLGSFTYESLARQGKWRVVRKEIYACVSCKFFSFYPTYAFCHYVVHHGSVEMLYVCATSPSCSKRCSSLEAVMSHMQSTHATMRSVQFRCTATLLDGLMSSQLEISAGQLAASDVPVHFDCPALPDSTKSSSEAAIEIVDDDESDDVVVSSPDRKVKESDDVEAESVLSVECIDCTDISGDSQPSFESATAEGDKETTELHWNSQERPASDKDVEEDVERDTVHSVEDKTSTVKGPDATRDTIISVCGSDDHHVTKLMHEPNNSADLGCHVVDETSTSTNSVITNLQRSAARACNAKISVMQNQVETVEITRSENSLLGIPLQYVFFSFEAQSSEAFRLLAMEKSLVPRHMLALLTDLVATVVDKQCSDGDVSSCSTVGRIPSGGSRTLWFQCLFCPYGELSAKRVITHVKQQHREYASFVQWSLLPRFQVSLYIYCRHCNFVTYDSAAMFIHFAVYHKVARIILPQLNDDEDDPDWAPVINKDAKAKHFPFYCCPNCRYIDAEWNRIIQHVLKKHSSESVLLGCVVRLVMVGRASKHVTKTSFTYESLARQGNWHVVRKEIYACVSCKFFSFYPTYAFCHYVVKHSSLEMLYVCAGSPSCSKQCSSPEAVISHIKSTHVAMKTLQFQCTATVLDGLTSTQLEISPGELVTADVPVYTDYQALPAYIRTSSEATIEIVDDDESDDVVVLSPACKDDDVIVVEATGKTGQWKDSRSRSKSGVKVVRLNKPTHSAEEVTVVLSPDSKDKDSDDVEPESVLSQECIDCTDISGDSQPSSESATAEGEKETTELHCNSQERPASEKVTEHCEEDVEPDDVHELEDNTLVVKAGVATCDTIISLCSPEDEHVTKLVHEENSEADLDSRVEDETSKTIAYDSHCEVREKELDGTESPSVQNPVYRCTSGTSHTELVDSAVDSTFPSKDDNPVPDVADFANHTGIPSLASNDENSAESDPVHDPFMGTGQTVDSTEDPTFSSKDTSQLIDDIHTPVADLVNNVSVSTNDSTAAGLAVQQTVFSQVTEQLEGVHDCTANESQITNPQVSDVCIAEQELFTSNQPNSAELFSECLGFDDDTISSSEFSKIPSDRLESSERCVLDLDEDVLLLSEELTEDEPEPQEHCSEVEHDVSCSVSSLLENVTDDAVDDSNVVSTESPCLTPCWDTSDDVFCRDIVKSEQLYDSCVSSDSVHPNAACAISNSAQEHCTENSVPSYADCSTVAHSESKASETSGQIDLANEQCNDSDSAESPVSVNRLRFQSLAGFRCPAPRLFNAKPS